MNLVPGAISGFIALTMLKSPRDPQRLELDVPSIVLLTIGIGALQYLLDEGERKDWFGSEVIVGAAALAACGLTAFVVYSLRARRPIVDLRALRDRSVWSGCILAAGFGTTLISLNFILPQFLQESIAFTPTLSGQYILLRGIPVVLLAPAIGAALGANKFDPRLLIAFGFFATGLGTGWIGTLQTGNSDFGTLIWPLVLAGIGTAFLIIPLLTIVIASVPAEMAPESKLVPNALGSTRRIDLERSGRRLSRPSATVSRGDLSRHASQRSIGAAGATVSNSGLYSVVQGQAFVLAYADITYLISALAFVLVPCVFIVRRPPLGNPIEPAAE